VADAKLDSSGDGILTVRAKIWSDVLIASVEAALGKESVLIDRIAGSNVWAAKLDVRTLSSGVHPLRVVAVDKDGRTAKDEIKTLIGSARVTRERAGRDQDNALAVWPEHGLLGTQFGPN